MCKTALYESRSCGCRWLRIDEQCGYGMGFYTCASLGDGLCKPAMKYYDCEACPVHCMGGCYDRNSIRMLAKLQRGVKLGGGIHRGDPGCELKCAVM